MMDVIFTPEFQAKFWMKVRRVRNGGCWEWQGKLTSDGYGVVRIPGHPVSGAHRVAYTLLKGEIPAGLMLDHLCRNPKCVNPGHLEAVDNRENVQRGYNARQPRAQTTHCRKGHPLEGDNVYMHSGHRRCRTCKEAYHRERYEAEKAGTRTPKADRETYHLTSPSGEEFVVGNMTQFCRERGLTQTAMSHVLAGRQKTHKGWSITRLDERRHA